VTEIVRPLDAALSVIEDGMTVVVPPDYGGVAMEATRTLIRRGVKHLHMLTLPASSLQADLLIGAGALASIETSAVAVGELGTGPRFAAAATAGTVAIKDATRTIRSCWSQRSGRMSRFSTHPSRTGTAMSGSAAGESSLSWRTPRRKP